MSTFIEERLQKLEHQAVATATMSVDKKITTTQNWQTIHIDFDKINTSNAKLLSLQYRRNKDTDKELKRLKFLQI